MAAQRNAEGIRVRHSRKCASREGRRCNCSPTYEANAYGAGQRRYKRFDNLSEAKSWRRDAAAALSRRTMVASSRQTVAEAAEEWLAGVRDRTVRSRKGTPYKPSATRGYERGLRLRILPALGKVRFTDLTRRQVQALADEMLREGLDPSTIKNTLNPLQAMYRRAMHRDEVAVNPTKGLELPKPQGKRDRIAPPEEAAALVAALQPADRAVWATAMYAGLRRGELRAVRWAEVDLAAGLIRVERGWDDDEGELEDGKTQAARRSVPIAAVLRDHLVEQKLRTQGEGLVFGASPTRAFEPTTIRRRARAAWKRAKLNPIGLHECRHTYASFMIAAGVNAKALSTYMGHASVAITLDRYGHLMPGNEEEAAGLLDAYLARSAPAPQWHHNDHPPGAAMSGRERSQIGSSKPD